jgi:tetratricopeptide (TPR) repeat protein
MAWLAAASLAGMAVTSTLSVFAIQSRDAARDQRREAEGLVEFMVGDLRDKLEPIGKLDVLDGVGSRVLAYYSRQDTSELSDDALVQRSRALNLMAEVAYNRGNLDEAQGLYRQAMAGTNEALQRAPNDPKRMFDHAQNVFYVGEMARYAGRPAQAELAYREYKRIADEMAKLEPDNLKYRMEVLYADEDLGISLYDQHRFTEARRQFESVLGPMEKLASLYPANMSYQKEFSNALAWLADTQRSQGDLDGAIATRERQVSALSRLLDVAADSDVRAKLITAHQGLGVVLAERRQSERAISELHSAVDEAESLIPIEPRNANWKSLAASARLDLARTLLSLDRRDEATQQAAAGCTLGSSIPVTFANSVRTRLQWACAMVRSRLSLAAGDNQQASKLGEQALASARTARSEDPIADRYRLAAMYRLVGDVRRQAGDIEGAKDAWNAALTQLPPSVTERPWESNEHAELLQRLGRAGEAAALSARLQTIGYRSVN